LTVVSPVTCWVGVTTLFVERLLFSGVAVRHRAEPRPGELETAAVCDLSRASRDRHGVTGSGLLAERPSVAAVREEPVLLDNLAVQRLRVLSMPVRPSATGTGLEARWTERLSRRSSRLYLQNREMYSG
jgi:hypothetical protein